MGLILAIETTTTNCSVALGEDGKLLDLIEDMGENYSHAERLHKYIAQILDQNNLTYSDLDAVAISRGPGSYTGLRIGVSSAKGLCFAQNIPLLAIDTLTSLAVQAQGQNADYIIPMLDARRMEVYSAVYDGDLDLVREIKAEVLTEDSFAEYLEKGKVAFVGNGVEKFKEICSSDNTVFITDALPSAREMLLFAEAKYKKSDIEDVAYFEPFYLKDFIAGR